MPKLLAYLANYSAMVSERQSAFNYLQQALKLAPSEGEVLVSGCDRVQPFQRDPGGFELYLKKAAGVGYSRTIIKDTPDFEGLQENCAVSRQP